MMLYPKDIIIVVHDNIGLVWHLSKYDVHYRAIIFSSNVHHALKNAIPVYHGYMPSRLNLSFSSF